MSMIKEMLADWRPDDYTLYYNNVFLQFKLKNKPITWVMIKSFFNGQKGPAVKYYISTGDMLQDSKEAVLYLDSIEEIYNPVFVPRYNLIRQGAHYIYRKPLRTAKRGISTDNTKLIFPILEIIPDVYKVNLRNINPNLQLNKEITFLSYLEFLNSPLKHYPIKFAIEKLKQANYFSIPISNDWAIGLSPIQKFNEILFYKNKIVGGIQQDTIIPLNKFYKQEIKDSFGQVFNVK